MQDYSRVTYTNQYKYKADHLEKELRKVRAANEYLRQVVNKQEREEKSKQDATLCSNPKLLAQA